MNNSEADLILDLTDEKKRLKEDLVMTKAILEVLKAKGFESEIIYIEYEIKENLRNILR